MTKCSSEASGEERRLGGSARFLPEAWLAGDPRHSLGRRLTAEAIGTSFLLIAIVGSGVLGDRLAGGHGAIALLANAMATAATLYALIQWLGPISGAHLNPLISGALVAQGGMPRGDALAYVVVQCIGALVGVGLTGAMFELPAYAMSSHVRAGVTQWLSEFLATFGLLAAVLTCGRLRPDRTAGTVAAYVGAVFWFTASGFANPAVTFARAFTDTVAGIRFQDVPWFLVAQMTGAIAATLWCRWLLCGAEQTSAVRPQRNLSKQFDSALANGEASTVEKQEQAPLLGKA